MLKGQDIVVLTSLIGEDSAVTYQEISDRAQISLSEAHAAVRRLQAVALLNHERRAIRRNVEEFLLHGIRYLFPMKTTGGWGKGLPTAYAAPVAEAEFAAVGRIPVWSEADDADMSVDGIAVQPIYPTAPRAARRNRAIYDRLALIDMLRGGRIRERRFAESKLKGMLV